MGMRPDLVRWLVYNQDRLIGDLYVDPKMTEKQVLRAAGVGIYCKTYLRVCKA